MSADYWLLWLGFTSLNTFLTVATTRNVRTTRQLITDWRNQKIEEDDHA